MQEIIVGLDIGTTKVCAVAGRRDQFGRLEVLGAGFTSSEGVERGGVQNIDKTIRAINEVLAEVEKEAELNVGSVLVGISSQEMKHGLRSGYILKESKDVKINQSDVARLVNDIYRLVPPPGNKIIQVVPQLYTVDEADGIKDPVGMLGTRLEGDFNVVTAPAKSVDMLLRCVSGAGVSVRSLDLEGIVLESIASSTAVLSEEDKEAGVAVVDIGGGTTDISVYYDGVLRHIAVIPYGGNIVTQDIRQGCMVTQSQAEQLKVKFGKALASETAPNEVIAIPGLRNRPPKEISRKNLSYIIQARMEDIAELVDVELEKSGFKNRLAAGIVLTGGASLLEDVDKLFELKTALDAQVGHPTEYLGKSDVERVKSPDYSTAIGLVLSGLDASEKYAEEVKGNNVQQVDTISSEAGKPKKGGIMSGAVRGGLRSLKDFLIDDDVK